MKRAYVDIPEGQIHYQIEGSGEPLVLLHQASFSSDEFAKLMPILGKHYRVLARDMLGYGMSDVNPPDYEIEDYARADVSFLNALGIRRASFVGVHTGSSIAAELSIAHPEMVDRLVLYALPSFVPDIRQACLKSYTFSPVETESDGSHLIRRFWRAATKMGPTTTPDIWNMNVTAMAMARGGAFHGEQAVFRYNEEERLPLVTSPTLLMSGTKEEFFRQRVDRVRDLIPDCSVRVVEGTSSYAALEQPEEFAQAVLGFLGQK